MSKNNNVNPGQYKVAGRERQGEDVIHEHHKKQRNELRKGRQKAADRATKKGKR